MSRPDPERLRRDKEDEDQPLVARKQVVYDRYVVDLPPASAPRAAL